MEMDETPMLCHIEGCSALSPRYHSDTWLVRHGGIPGLKKPCVYALIYECPAEQPVSRWLIAQEEGVRTRPSGTGTRRPRLDAPTPRPQAPK
eukprot:scaffold49326_cov29-Tisochrysis_lutea.AAC.10